MRFRHDVDRRRFVITRGSLRRLLGAALETSARAISIDTTAYGKPVLTGQCATSNIQFNVSHSGDLAVIVVTRDRRIGVDAEVLRSLPDMNDLVEQNFSPREREEYAQLPLHLQQLGFFNGWTRKEALVKAWGYGLHFPLDQFDVSLTPRKPAQIYRLGSVPGGQCGWQLYDFVPLPGAIAAIAMEQPSPGSTVQLEFTHS
jgi:4'-phosphopantetheinyl transferase